MSRETAKELLVWWFQNAGAFDEGAADSEMSVRNAKAEIASIVDEIVDAAVSEAIGRLIAVANAAGAKGDQ